MVTRPLGRTGLQASIVGLGAEHLDNKPLAVVRETIDEALSQGINIMDVFMPGAEVRRNIGQALGARRRDVIIQGHIGSVDLNQQYDISRDLPTCRRYFENMMTYIGTDYIDVGMLFFIDTDEDFDTVFHGEILAYALALKQQGVIRAIGASSHNPLVAKRVVESGVVEVLMFSINPAFDLVPGDKSVFDALESDFSQALVGIDPARAALYSLCESRGVAITVMKTFGAGKLLSPEHSPFAGPLTPVQCIHYALTRPAVASVLLGCQSAEEVRSAVAYLDADETARDYGPIVSTFAQDFSGRCMYCNHCRPCPANIDIAAVTRYLDIALLTPEAVPPAIAQHYKAQSAHGADCTACGSCESRCPFAVPVIRNMEQAARVFGF